MQQGRLLASVHLTASAWLDALWDRIARELDPKHRSRRIKEDMNNLYSLWEYSTCRCVVPTRVRCESQCVWMVLAALFFSIDATADDGNGSVSVNDKEPSWTCGMRKYMTVSYLWVVIFTVLKWTVRILKVLPDLDLVLIWVFSPPLVSLLNSWFLRSAHPSPACK